jgi:hypothetical protein
MTTTLFAAIGRTQHDRGGLVIEATLAGDAATAGALERAVGASLTEMGRGEEIAGRLLRVVASSASQAAAVGRITLYALVTGTRAAALAAARVYKGLECQISLLGSEISEIALVDRPLHKDSLAAPQKVAVIYKRSGSKMSITSAVHNFYGSTPSPRRPSDAEINETWNKMTQNERVILSIKGTLAAPSTGGKDFTRWYATRANEGSGNPVRRGGQFW